MQTRKTTIGARTKLTASMADLGSVVRLNSNNFNSLLDSLILNKALQLIERPVVNPIVHNPSPTLLPYPFEVFHNNLVSVEVGNNIFTNVMINPLHPTSFSSREFLEQPLAGASAFTLKFGTQILEPSFDLLDFSRIIKPAVGSDSEVVYSEVNAQNNVLRTTVLLSDNNLFRECEQEETPTFLIHSQKAFTNFPTEIFFIANRDFEFKLLSAFEQSQDKNISFDVGTSWEVISDRSFPDDRLCLGYLDHSTSLSHTSYSYLGRKFKSLSDVMVNGIMELEVLSDFVFPSIINTELQGFSVSLDSSNYLFSWIDSNLCSYSCSHNYLKGELIYKPSVHMSSVIQQQYGGEVAIPPTAKAVGILATRL